MVVHAVLRLVENMRRAQDGVAESRRLDAEAVPGGKLAIAFALKSRPRIDQREVDVEEDGPRPAVHRLYGPATTTAARSIPCARPAASPTPTVGNRPARGARGRARACVRLRGAQ